MEDLAWIQTATGRQFRVLEPKAETIDPLDIAHALAHTCRFNGHSQSFYSVAQHCCTMVAHLERQGADLDLKRWALLHDADEAYLPDVPRPVKPFLFVRMETAREPLAPGATLMRIIGRGAGELSEYEPDPPAEPYSYVPWATFAGRVMFAVAKRFRLFPLSGDPPAEIKALDLRMLATEKRDLLGREPAEWVALRGIQPFTEPVEPLRPEIAREQFLDCLRVLFPREQVPFTATQVGGRARSTAWRGSGKRSGMKGIE
jgi:hypothetical protein